MRCFSIVRAMGPAEVVEAFPFIEFSFEIDVAFVADYTDRILAHQTCVAAQLYDSSVACRV